MSLYTFIMKYRGGCYVSQARGPSLRAALRQWAEKLEVPEIQWFGRRMQQALIDDLASIVPQPIQGTVNAWEARIAPLNRRALVNIVKTVDDQRRNSLVSEPTLPAAADLYTFVMEYRERTYVSQITADGVKNAEYAWAMHLDVTAIPGFGERSRRSVIEDLSYMVAVPLDRVQYVWCDTVGTRREYALLNIVRTSREAEGRRERDA